MGIVTFSNFLGLFLRRMIFSVEGQVNFSGANPRCGRWFWMGSLNSDYLLMENRTLPPRLTPFYTSYLPTIAAQCRAIALIGSTVVVNWPFSSTERMRSQASLGDADASALMASQ
jgi:hypothetical protein